MSKDVILDRYARLYEIPNQLALLGHEIECFCLSYQSHEEGFWDETNSEKKLKWYSKSYIGIQKAKILTYPFHLLDKLKKYQPDLIVAASDIPHIVMGSWCAKKLRVSFAVDLYDNFEGFGQAKIPGMKKLLRKAVCNAQLITTTSQPLAEFVLEEYQAKGNIISMPSTIDKTIFYPDDKMQARKKLGLKKDRKYIGTAGGLYKDKGIKVIYDAWEVIKEIVPDVDLVLAGPFESDCPPPNDNRIHYLGSLTHQDVATLFQALDVGIISILDTPFGRYCFPQKAYEMLACNLSVVVASIGEMKHLFAQEPNMLFEAENSDDLAKKIRLQLSRPIQHHICIEDWSMIIRSLEPKLKALID